MIVTVKAMLLRDKAIAQYICGEISPVLRDYILVKTEHGREVAVCLTTPVSPDHLPKDLSRVVKKLTKEDKERQKRLLKDEEYAFSKVKELVLKYELPLKLSKVCYTFDKRRIFVYYTSLSRVDFRALIKEINSSLRSHVQMVQVTPVECARIIGGLGICGRPFCCTLFYKNRSRGGKGAQPSKSVGPCGKILCCCQLKDKK